MKNNQPLIRLTFSQERYNILIEKQLKGQATFNDLTELDEIVNRDPAIRESILKEMQDTNNPSQGPDKTELIIPQPLKPLSLLEQIKTFFNRLFTVSTLKLTTAL